MAITIDSVTKRPIDPVTNRPVPKNLGAEPHYPLDSIESHLVIFFLGAPEQSALTFQDDQPITV